MSCGYYQSLAVYVAVSVLGISMLLPPALGAAQFSKTPNDKTVKVGDTVSIVWDYSVDDRNTEFQQYSPVWNYYDQSGTKYELASEDKFDIWKWQISPTCPARLKHRLSKADTATLVITNVSLADSGKYECGLKLMSGSVPPSSMQLTVTVPPEFTPAPPSSKTIKEGDNLSIQCSAKGPPTPQVKWLHNGNILSQGQGSATLNIVNIKRSQSGIYECQASNNPNEQPAKTTTQVTVYYPPEITTSPDNITVTQGDDVILKCQASGNPPAGNSWSRDNNVPIKPGHTVSGGTLTIPNAVKSDAGKYICTAKNVYDGQAHTATAAAYVTVKYPPVITTSPDNTTVTQGDDVILKCQASGNPPASITWSRYHNVPIKSGHAVYSGTLTIPNAVKSDTGKYICTAKNVYDGQVHTATAAAYVTVKYPPSIVHHSNNQIINETDSLSLTCTADGYPVPTITWTKSPGTITPPNTGNVYTILSVKRSDAGTYTCTASNGIASDAMTSIQVTVQYKPSIDKASSTNNTRSWKGNTITLKCVVASGFPSPNFTWYKPSGDVIPCNQSSRTVSSHVTVQTGQDSGNYGLYRCIATNVVGSDQHYINVTQLFPPGRLNITVTDIEASSVIVRWTKPVYDGGSPVIQYKLIIDSKTFLIDAPNTHKSISGLTKNTKYEVKLHAKNIAGYGSASSKVFTTKKQDPPSLPEVKVDIHQTSVTLVWSKPDENGGEITKYTIYKKVIGIDFSWSKVADVTATSYMVEYLDPGKKYSFIVTASNQYGESLKNDSKAKTVVIPVEATTTTTTTHVASIVVGALAAFIAVFLLVNILLVLYIWRITRRTKSEQRKTDNLTNENAVEMAKTSPSSAATLHVPPANQLGVEYESVEPSSIQPQYETPQSSGMYEILDTRQTSQDPSHYQQLNPSTRNEIPGNPDNKQTSQEPSHYQELNPSTRNEIPGNPDNRQTSQDPSHYQQLNPSTIASQHDNNPIEMYEPLRLKPMDVRTGRRGGSKTEDIQQNTSFT